MHYLPKQEECSVCFHEIKRFTYANLLFKWPGSKHWWDSLSFEFYFICRVISLIFSDNKMLYKWTLFYSGHFFSNHPHSSPPPRKPPKLELPLMLNSSLSFWSRNMRFVLRCWEFSTLQKYDPFISKLFP